MKKLVGFVLLGAILFVAFFLLKDCNSPGGGNTPLAIEQRSALKLGDIKN